MDEICRHCGRSGKAHWQANTDALFRRSGATKEPVTGYTILLEDCPGFSDPIMELLEAANLLEAAALIRMERDGKKINYYE